MEMRNGNRGGAPGGEQDDAPDVPANGGPDDDEVSVERLFRSPELFLLGIESEERTALLLRLTRDDYRAAAFLDDRAIRPEHVAYRVDLDAVLDACERRAPAGRPPRLLMHTGFSCSTLLARCLDELDGCFVLKEPFVLHQLARLCAPGAAVKADANPTDGPRLLRAAMTLLSRTYDASDVAIVKADCMAILDALAGCVEQAPILFLYPELGDFVRSVLKMPERRAWARRRLEDAAASLQALGDPWGLAGQVREGGRNRMDGEVSACLWLVELAIFGVLYRRGEGRRMWALRGQAFLDSPARVLAGVARFFGLEASRAHIDASVSGPVMTTHAKQPTLAFSAAARAKEMAVSAETLRGELLAASRLADSLAGRLAIEAIVTGEASLPF